jgi:hypothetical protein
MRTLFKNIVLALFILSFIMPDAKAQDNGSRKSLEHVGTSMANYLKIGVGARASAMGGAYVALSDDITSLYWNPGGIGMVDHNEAVLHFTDWFMDSQIYFFGASYRIDRVGTIGLSLNSFDSGAIEETTVEEPEGTGRTFRAANHTIGLTYTRRLIDRFSFGITLKYVEERLDRTQARALAIDIGSVYRTNFLNNMRIGFAMTNLGQRMNISGSGLDFRVTRGQEGKPIQASYLTSDWDLPLMFRFGLATEIFENDNYRLTVSGDVLDSRDFRYRLQTGAEFAFQELIYLRGGYQFNYDISDFSLGVGLELPSYNNLGLRFDYSYENYMYFGGIQKISVFITY